MTSRQAKRTFIIIWAVFSVRTDSSGLANSPHLLMRLKQFIFSFPLFFLVFFASLCDYFFKCFTFLHSLCSLHLKLTANLPQHIQATMFQMKIPHTIKSPAFIKYKLTVFYDFFDTADTGMIGNELV